MGKSKNFDKYWYYNKSVQSADADVEFFVNTYKELKNKKPKIFREDFCGAFKLSCEWVKLDPGFQSVGIDIDLEPTQYGKKNYLSKLSKDQQSRVRIINGNVLSEKNPKADIIAACNFSYFIFKERETMKNYFSNNQKALNKNGIFILDIFGGSQCYEPNEEEVEHKGFSYFWDQDSYDPISNESMFYIHFKPKGQKKIKKVFSYDWRIYSIAEIKDLLKEVGFKKIHVYWEGTDENGEGDGEFRPATQGEDCESWIAYIIAEKP